ncbi:hypothetical protein M407DRAFT_245083 [Tulasnella calospora MUT 4182]|uniref:Uncharacterized protein n=1 Tax=Tulasnella calospora MUT 4182 TaxID=1051891 RepID=A0A0C3KMP3_9AGAM|nr:hypothetical protein M407DRAFT_245083 [Tulasnella calospora MUT 4182]
MQYAQRVFRTIREVHLDKLLDSAAPQIPRMFPSLGTGGQGDELPQVCDSFASKRWLLRVLGVPKWKATQAHQFHFN